MGRTSTGKANKKASANIRALGRRVDPATVQELRIRRLASMGEVCEQDKEHIKFRAASKSNYHRIASDHIQETAVSGDKARLARNMDKAERLRDEAIIADPRLARKARWERGEDGIFADPGLVASGDDSPCYYMDRKNLREYAAFGEPVVVVVSTDSNMIDEDRAAAFIATVQLVQQFRPVHVWWQGAWLDNSGREIGYVFHAPLIQNDMDFSRVDYVLADETRDNASFSVLFVQTIIRDKLENPATMGGRARRSYLPEGTAFVSHEGITPDAENVAHRAATWLGWDSLYAANYEAIAKSTAALQEIPEPRVASKPMSETERRKFEKESRDWQKQFEEERKGKARNRAEAVSGSVVM